MIEELSGDFLQWLRGFYYVATTGSVRAAASLMHRNPSTISYQVKALEEELGIMLFERHNKAMKITEEGKNLLAWTISTFETLKDMRSAVGNRLGNFQGSISMAATLPILALAGNSIGEFIKSCPKVHLQIERALSHEVRAAVMDAAVDFGILPVIGIPEHANFELIINARPMLVFHKANPWQISGDPTMEELKRLPYVSFIEKNDIDELGNYLRNTGLGDFVQRNSVIRINNYHMILRFVWQKLGVALMDELCFKATQFGAEWDSLVAVPLAHLLPGRSYGLMTRKNRRFGLQVVAFMNHLRGFFHSLSIDGTSMAWEKARQKQSDAN